MGRDPVATYCPLCVSRCGARAEVVDGRSYGFEPDALDAGLVDRVRADWRAMRPLVSWLRAVD
jgi:hypothetical protein